MDYSDNLRAFFNKLPKSTGQFAFLALAAYLAGGDPKKEIPLSDIRDSWRKGILKIGYNGAFYPRAQDNGWVNPKRHGVLAVTDIGFQHLEDVSGVDGDADIATNADKLHVFGKKHSHTFDKFLRGVIANASQQVLLADSYVDDAIFDRVLDSAQKNAEMKLIYAKKEGAFDSRVARFSKEHPKFSFKKYGSLHDRLLIVDQFGYVLGPSIKDATDNSPALIVKLSAGASKDLLTFFRGLWSKAK